MQIENVRFFISHKRINKCTVNRHVEKIELNQIDICYLHLISRQK